MLFGVCLTEGRREQNEVYLGSGGEHVGGTASWLLQPSPYRYTKSPQVIYEAVIIYMYNRCHAQRYYSRWRSKVSTNYICFQRLPTVLEDCPVILQNGNIINIEGASSIVHPVMLESRTAMSLGMDGSLCASNKRIILI
jgi:hypothetical protein